MTALNLSNSIRHLYSQGLRDVEICERLRSSLIFTRHVIARICHSDPVAESLHYLNRHKKGRLVKARIINDDPHWEESNRYDRQN